MARASVFVLSFLVLPTLLAAQQQLPRIAYDMKESVVKIEVHLIHVRDSQRVSDQLQRCFEESDFCVIGTGVRINGEGDVLTAAHVARDTNVVGETLRNTGIDSEVMVAGAAQNAEYTRANTEQMGGVVRASIKAIDSEHDVAVLEPERGGRGFTSLDNEVGSSRQGSREVKLDLERPTAGEAIFGFGFPQYSPGLIATTGAITLAMGSTNLLEAKKSGDSALVPIYRSKLEINPGNSGVALFRASDGALRGIVTEMAEKPDLVATIVPASEIAKVLSKYAIKWDAAPSQAANGASKPARRKHLIF